MYFQSQVELTIWCNTYRAVVDFEGRRRLDLSVLADAAEDPHGASKREAGNESGGGPYMPSLMNRSKSEEREA